MGMHSQTLEGWGWVCPKCRTPLEPGAGNLGCGSCRQRYPLISGIPILIADPAAYLNAQMSFLTQTKIRAGQRLQYLNELVPSPNLPEICIDRHRDVTECELFQCETLLSLFESEAELFSSVEKSGSAQRTYGWSFSALIPYLVRDWSSTFELNEAQSLIGASLQDIFGDCEGKSIAVAGCGAGGLLTAIPPSFSRVVGFDLSLPILRAAAHLLDGQLLRMPWPHILAESGEIVLGPHGGSAPWRGVVAAMDALNTAFPDGALDCVITSFLLDLIPEPQRLAGEIRRILAEDGVWMNYGPSGPLKSTWRFDNAECQAFFETAGFEPLLAKSHRTTYLDLSRDFPIWSSHNHICYLTGARKGRAPQEPARLVSKIPPRVERAVPRHYPAAELIKRQVLGEEGAPKYILRIERRPGKTERLAIGEEDVRIMELVDGRSTVEEIANQFGAAPPPATVAAFKRYFEQDLLLWSA